MYSRLSNLGRMVFPAAVAALLLALVFPTGGFAQGGRQMHLNQVESRTWPDVIVNMTITGPDGKAVPDINGGQFQVHEQGQPQAIEGLALGPAKDVPLALV